MKFIVKSFFVILLTSLAYAPAFAHNYHTSLTRIDFNKKEKTLEIEINLFNHDLEKVIKAKSKKGSDSNKTKDTDKILFDYISETFIVKDSQDSKKKLIWVGTELNTDTTTVFVEIGDIENYKGFKLQNTIFFESFAGQVNLVTLHSDEGKFDLMYKAGDSFKELGAFSQNKR